MQRTTSLPTDWQRSSRGRRLTAIGLTLAAELLFLLILLHLNPDLIPKVEPPRQPSLIELLPEAPKAAVRPRLVTEKKAAARAAAPAPAASKPLPPPPVVSVPSKSPLLEMSKEDMDMADISKLGTRGDAAAGRSQSASAAGPGEGPGGAHLYNARWVVRPTDAQIGPYMPKSDLPSGSWAMIECKTIAHYHVENCQPLGESPAGSGLARGMRLAAWQFLVRPEAIDEKLLVGSWVKIYFEFTEAGEVKDRPASR